MFLNVYGKSRAPDPSLVPTTRAPILQRKCACGGQASGEKCQECQSRSSLLQRSAITRNYGSWRHDGEAPPLVGEVLRSTGAPLDGGVRGAMESQFDRDFRNVRVHTGSRAAASARAVGASAYTVGRDVVFGDGQYTPGSSRGRSLLAHELTHVLQQGAVPWRGGALKIGAADTEHEHQAEQASAAGGAPVTGSTVGGATLQRQPSGGPEMPGDAGGLFLRGDGKGRIEILVRPPAAPVIGNVGAGFRCENGKCAFVGGKDPADIGNRTYTPQEAMDLLSGKTDAPTASGGTCPPGRQAAGGLCCPVGTIWDDPQSACVPMTVNLCDISRTTPFGTCCPPGERWDYLNKHCAARSAGTVGPTIPTLPPLTSVPSLSMPKPRFRFGTIESATYDDFVTDHAEVPSKHNPSLDHLADLLNLYQDAEVHIEGHTDTTADDAHNNKLSRQRAESIRNYLLSKQVSRPERLKPVGFGEREPRVFPERTANDRSANRRVDVWFQTRPTDLSGGMKGGQ